jgi:hypothetical protein
MMSSDNNRADLKPRATMSASIKMALNTAMRGGARLSGEKREAFLKREQENLTALIRQMKP